MKNNTKMDEVQDILSNNLSFLRCSIQLNGLPNDKEISREFIIKKNYELAHFCLLCLQMFDLTGVSKIKLLDHDNNLKYSY